MLLRKITIGFILLLSIWAFPCAQSAHAQRYKTSKPAITEKAAKSLYRKVSSALRDPGALAANQGVIDDYFKKYLFPTMTDISQDGLGQLAKRRDDLFRKILRSATSKPAQDHITNLTLDIMRKIVLDRYHPAVRYNAVLILGELDQQYATKDTPKPTPLPAGTKTLLILLENDELKGVKVPSMLKVGALVGLERHARFGIDPQYTAQVTAAAIGLIQQQETPTEMDPEVHHWLKCLAGRVLVQQFATGPNADVNGALISMIEDQEMSLEDRCCVSALLKKMDYSAAQGLDTASAVTALGNLTQAVTHDEADQARDFKEELLSGNQGAFRGGTFRGARGGQESGPPYEKRRLLDRLLALKDGIEAVTEGANPEGKSRLEALVPPLQPVIDTASEKDTTGINIADPVIEMASEIDRVLRSWKQSDQPSEENSDDEFS